METNEFKALANNLYDFLDWMENFRGVDVTELIEDYNKLNTPIEDRYYSLPSEETGGL